LETSVSYRKEVDGLRAIAIIPVILYHAGFSNFSGGYFGVDVFFVISGYLITIIIIQQIEIGKFNLISFYERRARRLLPAQFLVIFTCIPLAWLFLPADLYKNFSQSIFFAALFGANIFFWRESSYFAPSSQFVPLIHTWSLGIEAQFYLFFSLLLFLCWRFSKRYIIITVSLFFIASFIIFIFFASSRPITNFYLLPSRIWELLVGALIALYLSKISRRQFNEITTEILGWSGLVLILFSIFTFDKLFFSNTVYVVFSTFGAALVLVFANKHTLLAKFIGNKAFVAVGLISYSLYLWHQPLLVFARFLKAAPLSLLDFCWIAVVLFILAYASWKLVERPFRDKRRINRILFFRLSIFGILFFLIIGILGHLQNGFPDEKKNQFLTFKDYAILTDENFIVLGDSHAGHLVSGLKSITSGEVSEFSSAGCIPLRNVDRYDARFTPGTCSKIVNSWLNGLLKDDARAIIVLSSMGSVYLDGTPFKVKVDPRTIGLELQLTTDTFIRDRYKVFEIGLHNTLAELSGLKHSRVIIALDIPELGIEPSCIKSSKQIAIKGLVLKDFVYSTEYEKCSVTRAEFEERQGRYRALVKSIVSEYPRIYIFDPAESFCNKAKCRGFSYKFGYLYSDQDHLNEAGSRYYAEAIYEYVKSADLRVISR
jgi:peptidoglycan/LPS O-acetylase OafA/YrhL